MTNEELKMVSEVVGSSLHGLRSDSAHCFDDDTDYAVIVDTFASGLAETFPQFDRAGFYAECGLVDDETAEMAEFEDDSDDEESSEAEAEAKGSAPVESEVTPAVVQEPAAPVIEGDVDEPKTKEAV